MMGRLTLVSGKPVMNADVIGATTLYWTPYGAAFAEVSLALSVSPNALYDVFLTSLGALALGPAWVTTRAIELPRVGGILVNPLDNTQSYLGTISTDSGGKLNAHFSYGQNRRFDVWNNYNRVPIILRAGDNRPPGTNGFKYTPYWGPGNFGASNNDPGNSLTVLCGVAEETIRTIYRQAFFLNTTIGGAGTKYSNAVGWGIVNGPIATPPGFWGADNTIDTGTLAASYTGAAEYIAPPFEGSVTVTALENARTTGVTAYWSETNMLLTACWRG